LIEQSIFSPNNKEALKYKFKKNVFMQESALFRYFDKFERTDLLFINFAFLIIIIPGIIFGLLSKISWMLYVALVVLFFFVCWNCLYFYIKFKLNKQEKELLKTIPSFPQLDFCDYCGKSLEDSAPAVIDSNLIIICPHCGKENIVKSEEEIEQINDEKADSKLKEI